MWLVNFSRDGTIEQQEIFDSYYHAQMYADNLILSIDCKFGTINFPIYKNNEKYNKNGIIIEINNGDNDQNDVERNKDLGYVAWIQSRSTKNRWDS